MSTHRERYQELDARLTWVRWAHQGRRSDQEDALLEEMDTVWGKMEEAERIELSYLPACSEDVESTPASETWIDEVVSPKDRGPVRRLQSVA